ncbi:MAG: GDSL-type esterase/lipase family protein [Candidatus Cryptobacteroides sp.]|nr:GDSL-type esterase/lipase family protein [Bacteroidales bacterium]
MDRLQLSLAAALICCISFAREVPETVTPASDSRITYVGRTLAEGDNVTFNWTAVYAKISFEGNYLALKASDTKKNYYDIWVDRPAGAKADRVVAISGKDSLYVLVDEELLKSIGMRAQKQGSHNVIIKRRTEGEQGTTTFSGFVTKGNVLQAEGLKPRQFEVIGDSYTCGYGTEESVRTDPFLPETENSNLTYAAILARYFNADYFSIAHSGMGIARNYNDKLKGDYMPDRYLRVFDEEGGPEWKASESPFKPKVTIIYLCTNDFSCERQPSLKSFKDNYIRLLKSIKANYGEEHPVLCMASRCDDLAADYVREAARSCGLENVYFLGITEMIHDNDSELGASWHPNYKGHIKLAHSVIPYVSTITGWEINDNIK